MRSAVVPFPSIYTPGRNRPAHIEALRRHAIRQAIRRSITALANIDPADVDGKYVAHIEHLIGLLAPKRKPLKISSLK